MRETDRLADQAQPGAKGATSAPLYRDLGSVPRFLLHSLEPGAAYQLLIYAKNAMGVSEPPVVIEGVRVTASMERLTGRGELRSRETARYLDSRKKALNSQSSFVVLL